LLAGVYFLIYISKKLLYKHSAIAHFIGTVQFQFIILISIAYQYSRPGGPRHYFTGPDGGNSFQYERDFHLTDLLEDLFNSLLASNTFSNKYHRCIYSKSKLKMLPKNEFKSYLPEMRAVIQESNNLPSPLKEKFILRLVKDYWCYWELKMQTMIRHRMAFRKNREPPNL